MIVDNDVACGRARNSKLRIKCESGESFIDKGHDHLFQVDAVDLRRMSATTYLTVVHSKAA